MHEFDLLELIAVSTRDDSLRRAQSVECPVHNGQVFLLDMVNWFLSIDSLIWLAIKRLVRLLMLC